VQLIFLQINSQLKETPPPALTSVK